jgi:hypothetical protein
MQRIKEEFSQEDVEKLDEMIQRINQIMLKTAEEAK